MDGVYWTCSAKELMNCDGLCQVYIPKFLQPRTLNVWPTPAERERHDVRYRWCVDVLRPPRWKRATVSSDTLNHVLTHHWQSTGITSASRREGERMAPFDTQCTESSGCKGKGKHESRIAKPAHIQRPFFSLKPLTTSHRHLSELQSKTGKNDWSKFFEYFKIFKFV